MKFTNSLLTAAAGLALASTASAGSLGAASNFNVFVRQDFTSQGSDTEGNMAVGGNLSVSGYSIALKTGGIGKTVLEVGKKLSFSNGTIHGDSLYGTATATSNFSSGTITQGSTIDFSAAFTDLKQRSAQWAAMSSNGSAVFQYSTLTLTGSSSDLNIFNITAADLDNSNLYQVKFVVPAGAKALVNVSGMTGNFRNIGYDNLNPESILWNFSTATKITNNSFKGSLLAPNADVVGGYGAIDGQVIANSFSGPTQINNHNFSGALSYKPTNLVAPVPEPTTIALGIGGLVAAMRRRRSR